MRDRSKKETQKEAQKEAQKEKKGKKVHTKKEEKEEKEEKKTKILVRHSEAGLPLHERRMDTLAKLLAAHSICVAIAAIDGKLYIAANGMHSGSHKKNRIVESVETITNYFKGLCEEKKTSRADRETIFKNICSHYRLLTLVQPRALVIKKDLASQVANQVFHQIGAEMPLGEVMCKKRKNATAFVMLYAEYSSLYRAFIKMEKSIKANILNAAAAVSKNTKSLDETQFTALSTFTEEDILKRETSGEVHAEMQILSYIFNIVVNPILTQNSTPSEQKTIYIGISRLCCVHCKLMIEAANEMLKEKKIPITFKTRGTHGLSCKNWEIPDAFKEGYLARVSSATPNHLTPFAKLIYEVGKLGRKKIDAEKKRRTAEKQKDKASKTKAVLVSQMASDSESDAESPLEDNYKEKIEALNKKRHSFCCTPSFAENKEDIRYVQKISIAIQLYTDVASFKLLLKQGVVNDTRVRFAAIKREFCDRAQQAEVDGTLLLETLQDTELVGQEVSRRFASLSLEESKMKGSSASRNPLSQLPPPSLRKNVKPGSGSFFSSSSSREESKTKASRTPLSPLPPSSLNNSGPISGSFFSSSSEEDKENRHAYRKRPSGDEHRRAPSPKRMPTLAIH